MSTLPIIQGIERCCKKCSAPTEFVQQPGGDLTWECPQCHYAIPASLTDEAALMQYAVEWDSVTLSAAQLKAFHTTRAGLLLQKIAEELRFSVNMCMVLYTMPSDDLALIEAFIERCRIARRSQ